MNSKWRIIGIDPNRGINGVWRLSDDKKFFLGDMTFYGTICEFSVKDSNISVKCSNGSLYGISEVKQYRIVSLDLL